ncbi:MAG: hypothetical protein PUF72_05460 [Clostridiales bacterium]|nr:hypothetical protein [Clostridiales bacterium]
MKVLVKITKKGYLFVEARNEEDATDVANQYLADKIESIKCNLEKALIDVKELNKIGVVSKKTVSNLESIMNYAEKKQIKIRFKGGKGGK